jgi:hypothetical protein
VNPMVRYLHEIENAEKRVDINNLMYICRPLGKISWVNH